MPTQLKRKPTVIDLFIAAVPNQLAELGHGLEDTSALAAFQPRPVDHDSEIRRALILVDIAMCEWAAEAVRAAGQENTAGWLAQLPAASSPEQAGHLGGLVRSAKGSVHGFARQAVLDASLAADAAGGIDELPGADNEEALAEVVVHAARCLAASTLERGTEVRILEDAVATAELLAGPR